MANAQVRNDDAITMITCAIATMADNDKCTCYDDTAECLLGVTTIQD